MNASQTTCHTDSETVNSLSVDTRYTVVVVVVVFVVVVVVVVVVVFRRRGRRPIPWSSSSIRFANILYQTCIRQHFMHTVFRDLIALN